MFCGSKKEMEENSDGDLRNLGLIGKHMPQAQHCFRAFFSFFVKNITGLVRGVNAGDSTANRYNRLIA
jgi:hypothetical protein